MALTAKELQTKFDAQHAAHSTAIGTLEREREALLLDKLAGDPAAMERSQAIRAELDDRASSLRELAQIMVGLEPRLRLEQAEAERAYRAQQGQAVKRLLDAAATPAAEVDAAIDALQVAVGHLVPLLDRAQNLVTEVTRQKGADIGQQAIMRMAQGSVVSSPQDLIEARLRALGVLRNDTGVRRGAGPIAETVKQAAAALLAKVADRLQADVRQAEADEREAAAERAPAAA